MKAVNLNSFGYTVWKGNKIYPASFQCGYCGSYVTSNYGMALGYGEEYNFYNNKPYGVYICTKCNKPTFISSEGIQIPGSKFGSDVKGVSEIVNTIYNEARDCYAADAYTGTVLLSRKLLMHIAIDLGANEGKNFKEYVDFLANEGFITATSRGWVDVIRKISNASNHELVKNTKEDAENLLQFCEMILKTNYEYPSSLK